MATKPTGPKRGYQAYTAQLTMSDYTVPSSDTAFEEMSNLLQHCDKGELQELMDNEERLNGIVADLEEVRALEVTYYPTLTIKRIVIYSNEQLDRAEQKIKSFKSKVLV